MQVNNLRHIRTFVAVAQEASFSAAGRRLSISQPAVSKQMRELEAEVGTELFERGRRLVLTEAGQALLQYAGQVILSAERLEAALEGRTVLRGHLQIGASTVWEYVLPRAGADFLRDHPEVTMGLRIGNSEQVARMVAEREVRLGFVGAHPGRMDVEAVPAGDDELVLVVSRGHALARAAAVHPAALAGQPYVLRERDSATAQIALRHLRQLGIEPWTIMEMGSNEAVKAAVRGGAGIGVVSLHAVEEDIRMGAMRELKPEGPPCTRPLYALRNTRRSPTPLEAAFLQEAIRRAPRRRAGPAPR